tara:strand:- start:81 stop:428 length:348 start_codon:yes stop_codon:yes gene_type:complete
MDRKQRNDIIVCVVALILIALILVFGGKDAYAHTEVKPGQNGTIWVGNEDLGEKCAILVPDVITAKRTVVLMEGGLTLDGFLYLNAPTPMTEYYTDQVTKFKAFWLSNCTQGDDV